jgi:methionyl-tRNA formyltransferase
MLCYSFNRTLWGMKKFEDLRIVFFGTPDFAVATLSAIVASGGNVVAVVTAPDKPAGRGQHLQASPVKLFALEKGLPVLQPPKMKNPDFLIELKYYAADLQVVVAFRMMPVEVWDMPPLGTYNVHGSLLPQYRGAAPINRAIMNGEPITGVTTFKLKHEIDTGDILLHAEVPITEHDNAGTMHDKLMEAGAQLMVTTLKGIAAGSITERPQDTIGVEQLHPAPKIFKDDMLIHWDRSAREIHNFIRGLSPYPGAHTVLAGKQVKIFRSKAELTPVEQPIGSYQTDHTTYLRFAASDGWVYALQIQQEGKKSMDIEAFLRGFRA